MTDSSPLTPADSHLYLGGQQVGGDQSATVPGIELDDLAIWDLDLENLPSYQEKMVGDTCPPSIVDPLMFHDTEYFFPIIVDLCPLRINQTCIEDLLTLYDYINEGNEHAFDMETIPIAMEILYNGTMPGEAAMSDAMLYKVMVSFNTLCQRIISQYNQPISKGKTEHDLDELVNIVSNLLYPLMYTSAWHKINTHYEGLPSMIHSLETVALHLIKMTDALDLEIDVHFSNLYIMAKKFQYSIWSDAVKFPVMNYDTMNATVGEWRGQLDSMLVGHSIFREATNNTGNMTVSLVTGIYDTMDQFFPTRLPEHLVLHDTYPTTGHINARMFTAKMHPMPADGWFRDAPGVRFKYHVYKETEEGKDTYHCMLWDPEGESANPRKPGAWTDVGCSGEDLGNGEYQCTCPHMTTYALLLKPLPEPAHDPHEMPIRILTYIGIIVSMVVLTVFTFKVFALKQKRRDIPTILRNLTLALIVLLLVVAIAESAGSERPTLCQAMSILMHYLYCVVYCWLWIESVDLLYTITTAVMFGRLKFYILFCWGIPLLPVIGLGIIDLDSYGVQPHCWIKYDGYYHLALFGVSLLFIFLSLITSLINMCNIFNPALKDETVFAHVRVAVRNSIVLFPLLSLAWLFSYFALEKPDQVAVQYLSAIFYSFQGFFIVMAHSISNPYFYVMREQTYEQVEEEEEDEDDESKASSRPSTAVRPETARPKTGQVKPRLIYRP